MRGDSDKGQPTYWPDWIQERRPDVNIWRADYDSSLNAWLQPAMPLDQIAGSLLMHAQDQGLGTRPIHWVGHSMGGLVIKHLLCRAQTRTNSELHKIGTVPTVITFLGTPHHGSDVADWKAFFGGLLTALDLYGTGGAATGLARLFKIGKGSVRNAHIESHVKQLSVHSESLGKLNEDFAQWVASAAKMHRLVEPRNYYEMLPVKNAVVVVPKRSAQLANGSIEDIPAQEDHLSICKYASRKNAVFTGVDVSLRALCLQSYKPPVGDYPGSSRSPPTVENDDAGAPLGMTAGTRDSSPLSSRPVAASELDVRSAVMPESAQQTHDQIAPLDKPAREDMAARFPDVRPADPTSETVGTSPLPKPILLLTVNQRETDALRVVFGAAHIPNVIVRDDYPYERFSPVIDATGKPEREVIAFSCQMGSERSGAALQRVTKAIEHFEPAAVLAVGVGFGLKDNQSLGDVLISSQVTTYESARLNKDGGIVRRAETLPARSAWLERAKLINLEGIERRVGLVLCGEKLVDNASFRESLRRDYPLAIGGDMESFGVATACNGHDPSGISWLVIKGISDLGDGAKNAGGESQSDLDQYQAAYCAAIVAYSAVYLRPPDVPPPDQAAKAWLLRQAGAVVGVGVESDSSRGGPSNDAASGEKKIVPLDRNMLRHQADDAIKSLRRASAYWTALQASENLNNWWKAEHLVSPQAFVESLLKCPPETKPEVMSELSAVFKDRKSDLDEKALGDAAAATVACFLLCACSVIKADARDAPIALPSVSERNAAHLLASLIAVVMTGGRLELRQGDGVLPRGSGTYRVQSTGVNAQFDFERQLYSDLVRNPWSVSSGQKTGGLSDDERNELLEVLRNRRGYGVRTKAMCFIIDSDEMPVSAIDVAREIGVPVFHASAEVVEVIFGVDKATLVTQLKHLWTDVCAYQSPDAAETASS